MDCRGPDFLMTTGMKANFKVFHSIQKAFQYCLLSQHFSKCLRARYSCQKILRTWLFEISIDIFLSLLSEMGRREFDVIVTFNVSSIVSINHLLIISHRAHLSQTLNHIHRLVSCVLFKTTRYFKTRLSEQSTAAKYCDFC